MMMRGTQICAIMCDVKRDEDEIYTFGRNVYSCVQTCILEHQIVDRIEKEMSRFSHFLSLFSSSKRDEIIEISPTFQGRQKRLLTIYSERSRLKEIK